jgi:hypothetical protein
MTGWDVVAYSLVMPLGLAKPNCCALYQQPGSLDREDESQLILQVARNLDVAWTEHFTILQSLAPPLTHLFFMIYSDCLLLLCTLSKLASCRPLLRTEQKVSLLYWYIHTP